MKLKSMAAAVLLLSMVTVACDDNTDTIGQSLTDDMDFVQIHTDTFNVATRSIKVDSVFSRTATGSLGRVKDPETGAIVTGNFTTMLHVLEGVKTYSRDSLYSYAKEGTIYADSCDLRLYAKEFEGDSLSTIKVTLYELSKPINESQVLYSNFDPAKEGFLRSDANALKVSKTFTLSDHTIAKSVRESSTHAPNIRITLNTPYTDKNGNTYKNYGSYILKMFYDHPEYFKNSQTFANNVCPGFYIKTESGVGCMAYISETNLGTYFRYTSKSDTAINAIMNFSGTEEVMQHTTIANDRRTNELVAESNCTYLKTPAGIFTEMTIPVDDIMNKHSNDTLNTANVTLTRYNNTSVSDYKFDYPQYLLMVQKDSLYSYFEKGKIPDNKESFIATYGRNQYVFNNIGNLVRHMYQLKKSGKASENWNKVVLVPVETKTNSNNAIIKVNHLMEITSARLLGGPDSGSDIKLKVIYSKFSDQ